MTEYSESEQVIRRLYQITNDYDEGFDNQLKSILKMGLERFHLDIGILSKIKDNVYVIKQCVCPDEVPLKPGDQFELGLTYCSVTCNSDTHLALEEVGKSDVLGKHPAYMEFGLESYIGIPIRFKGEIYGTLNFSSSAAYPRKFKDIDIDSLQLMASWIEVELIRRHQEKLLIELNRRLEEKASTDSLTKIPNRRSLYKHLRKEVNRVNRNHSRAALVMIDIDHFKKINDRYGHQTGDKALIAVARVLQNALRDYDFVGRYGGEEFMLWLPEVEPGQIDNICARLMKDIADISLLKEPMTISSGICAFSCATPYIGSVDHMIDRLTAKADQQLYEAKSAGRNCYRLELIRAHEIE